MQNFDCLQKLYFRLKKDHCGIGEIKMEDFKKEILIKTNSKVYYEDNLEMEILELSESALKDFFGVKRVFLGK